MHADKSLRYILRPVTWAVLRSFGKGSAITMDAVIKFSDAMILALVFPNMVGLFILFPKVKKELRHYLEVISKIRQGR